MDYTTLSHSDKLLLARDTLRARESDHYRFGLTGENPSRVDDLEQQIITLREVVAELEADAPAPGEADPAPAETPKKTTRRKKAD